MASSGRDGGRIRNAILIAGPTASGKSALAMQLAEKYDGVIVNADSMQVYSVLRVLTARPSDAETAGVPHRLYGHVHPSDVYSTGVWLRDVGQLVDEGLFERHRPIFVGGTGLYFTALTMGLSEMPDVPNDIRERWRWRLNEQGSARLHDILMRLDSAAAMGLRASDGQRIVRALEVLEASGKSILFWQKQRSEPLVDFSSADAVVVEPYRQWVIDRIEARFDTMMTQGAVEEVQSLLALQLRPAVPAMKAIGVPEITAALAGEISFEEAKVLAKAATRQYSKRQSTWFRNQFGPEWRRVHPT
ncbi:tRNA (adenosine(37)-N6)-dimethylallyltransferase MiaA [Corticibacterium sp. UT-5YL-CI-8]|nr:tRNA (adenosine(37)-N6)-dimethylallyltransferase MiaA [Tianweitania sp. UT-5YL-CI-8]